ncbi:MAG TPA: carbohydrate ABC transporter permease [Chloroflexota bacterium]|jgi:multiple sugar transport system permease protein|nr:carbohydrate ABC transporter permease [Chloroflexota bacterium]
MSAVVTPGAPVRAQAGRATLAARSRAAALYALMLLVALLAVFPLMWAISTSFKDPRRVLTLPPQLIPDPFVPENYLEIFRVVPFHLFIWNSVKVTLFVLVLRLLACSLAGYSFARLRTPGRDVIFGILLASLMVPGALAIIPRYMIYQQLGWIDTHLSIVVAPAIANTFGTFLMRQYFMTLPKELEEAALIDGATHPQIFARVMLPLAGPALAALAIFTFTTSWNSFLEPLVYLRSVDLLTIPPGLSFFGRGSTNYATAAAPPSYNLIMAGSVVAVIPTIAVFLVFQRYFTRGIAMTGLKG